MNSKNIAGIVVVLLIGLIGYFLTQPFGNSPNNTSEKDKTKNQDNHSENTNDLNSQSLAFQEFLDLKKENDLEAYELDIQLKKLSEEYANDYRFTLERIRGDEKISGIHSHKEEFELLAKAAQISIECACGDAEKMLNDLKKNSRNKVNGFWKLSTHPKQWNSIIEALKHEDVGELEKMNGNHH